MRVVTLLIIDKTFFRKFQNSYHSLKVEGEKRWKKKERN